MEMMEQFTFDFDLFTQQQKKLPKLILNDQAVAERSCRAGYRSGLRRKRK
jgi:hypothetical protein